VPNRIIRDGFVDSEAVNSLSEGAENFYHRLLLVADDAGRLDARPDILRARLFPLKSGLRNSSVAAWKNECIASGLITQYESNAKPYLQVTRWQRCGKALNSKCPNPSGNFEIRYVERETKDGPKQFVAESVPHTDPIHTPSAPHAYGVASKTNTETETETETKGETPSAATPRVLEKPNPNQRSHPLGDHSALIAYFVAKWQDRYGKPYDFKRGKDGSAASSLLKETCKGDLVAAKRLIDDYVADDYGFFVQNGHPLALLRAHTNRYLAGAHKSRGPAAVGRNGHGPPPPPGGGSYRKTVIYGKVD
jgi:hypothetical protein